MIKVIPKAAVVIATLMPIVGGAEARNAIIVLGTPTPQHDQAGVGSFVIDQARGLRPGDTLTVLDGERRTQIGPALSYKADDPAWRTPAQRRRYQQQLGYSVQEHIAKEGGASRSWRVAIPDVLATVAEMVPNLPDRQADIIVIGRLLHVSPSSSSGNERTWDMTPQGHIPNDAALKGGVGPYGTRGRENALRGVKLHFCYVEGDSDFASPTHRTQAERVWRIYTMLQGAEIGSVAPYSVGCIERFVIGATSPINLDLKPEGQPAMIVADAVAASVAVPTPTPPVPAPAPPPSEPIQILPPCSRPPDEFRSSARVGIRWKNSVDIDLYTRSADGNWIFFAQRLDRNGIDFYPMDYRVSPGEAWEFVEYVSRIDLKRLRIRINFYAGAAREGVPFQVRLWLHGSSCVYTRDYRLEATSGNGGADGPSWQRHWIEVKIDDLLGVADQPAPPNRPARR